MPSQIGKKPRTLMLSTDDVPLSQRQAYWQECVARTYLAVSIQPQGELPFRASLKANTVHDITVAHHTTTAQNGQRSVRPANEAQDERCLLLINLGGVIHVRHNERDISLGRNDMTVIDSRLPSEYSIPEGAATLSVNMPRQALVERFPMSRLFAAAKLPANLPMQQMTIGFFNNLYENFGEIAAGIRGPTSLRLANHAIDMLGIALTDALDAKVPASPYRAALLWRIKVFIDEHLHEPMLSAQVVAAKYRITARYVAMLFREEGITFTDFVRLRRLERCRRQLERAGMDRRQIGEIALGAGFASQAHFSRLFRAAYDATPRQYRNAFQHAALLPDRAAETNHRPRQTHAGGDLTGGDFAGLTAIDRKTTVDE